MLGSYLLNKSPRQHKQKHLATKTHQTRTVNAGDNKDNNNNNSAKRNVKGVRIFIREISPSLERYVKEYGSLISHTAQFSDADNKKSAWSQLVLLLFSMKSFSA